MGGKLHGLGHGQDRDGNDQEEPGAANTTHAGALRWEQKT